MTFIPPFQSDFVYVSITKIILEAFILVIRKHYYPLRKMLVFLWGVVYNLDIHFGRGLRLTGVGMTFCKR